MGPDLAHVGQEPKIAEAIASMAVVFAGTPNPRYART